MAHDSLGSKNQPQYSSSGASSQAADLSEVANYAAYNGNMKSDVSSVRTGLSGNDLWDGLWFDETDTGIIYRRVAGAWVPWYSTWLPYTPTLSNFAVGTGGSALSFAEYRYEAQEIAVRYAFILGTSGLSMGATPGFSLPVNSQALKTSYEIRLGDSTYVDVSAGGIYPGHVMSTAVGAVQLRHSQGGGTNAVGGSSPFVWAAGDQMVGEFRYRI